MLVEMVSSEVPSLGLCSAVFMKFHLKEEAKELPRVPFILALIPSIKALPLELTHSSGSLWHASITTLRLRY